MNARSHLYVPANDAERLSKSVTRGADALIIDLEDGVSLADKNLARSNLSNWLASLETTVEIWVRVNPEVGMLEKDIDTVASPKVTGIVLAKSTLPDDIWKLHEKLNVLESERGIERRLEVSALIESALGVLNALEIAKSARVSRLQIGEFDLRADIGVSAEAGDATVQHARSMAVFASAAAGINPPVAPVSTNFKDLDAFRLETQSFKNWGYFGRACIHPAQVQIANEVFTPTHEELSNAQDILDRLLTAGGGVALDSRGRMIDEASAKIARRTLSVGKLL